MTAEKSEKRNRKSLRKNSEQLKKVQRKRTHYYMHAEATKIRMGKSTTVSLENKYAVKIISFFMDFTYRDYANREKTFFNRTQS